jgi:hypothetical protein
MGCNCGSKKVAAKTYEHTDKNGKVTAYKSEAEANAAKARRGGTVTVR